MSILDRVPLDQLTPARLWKCLDTETRLQASRAFVTQTREDAAARARLDATIAGTLRFRVASVRKLEAEKKAGYLARLVQPDEGLASSLLQVLHLGERKPILKAFLDALGIANEDGAIADDNQVEPPTAEAVDSAARKLAESHPADHVEVYLLSLLALDPDTWGGVRGVLQARAGGQG